MQYIQKASHFTIALVSLMTAAGVFMHDTKLDQATITALALPVTALGLESVAKPLKMTGDPHTHSERGSLSQAIRGINGGTPRVQPRDDDKKYHLQKKVAKGVHAFDGYYMPLS